MIKSWGIRTRMEFSSLSLNICDWVHWTTKLLSQTQPRLPTHRYVNALVLSHWILNGFLCVKIYIMSKTWSCIEINGKELGRERVWEFQKEWMIKQGMQWEWDSKQMWSTICRWREFIDKGIRDWGGEFTAWRLTLTSWRWIRALKRVAKLWLIPY